MGRRLKRAFLWLAFALLLARGALAADPVLLFSYEALPSAQISLPKAKDAPALMLLRLRHSVIVETLAVRFGWR